MPGVGLAALEAAPERDVRVQPIADRGFGGVHHRPGSDDEARTKGRRRRPFLPGGDEDARRERLQALHEPAVRGFGPRERLEAVAGDLTADLRVAERPLTRVPGRPGSYKGRTPTVSAQSRYGMTRQRTRAEYCTFWLSP